MFSLSKLDYIKKLSVVGLA